MGGLRNWMDYVEWRDRLFSALDDRFYTAEWLDTNVASGNFRVWTNDRAAIIAETRRFPTGAMAVQGVCAAGVLAEIVGLIPEAEAWGKEAGAQYAFIDSREAWTRILGEHGYDLYKTAVLKEL